MNIDRASYRKISTTKSMRLGWKMCIFSAGLDVLLEDSYVIHCLIKCDGKWLTLPILNNQ